MTSHIATVHHRCTRPHCNLCDRGLFLRSVCGLAEGAPTTHCPGNRVGDRSRAQTSAKRAARAGAGHGSQADADVARGLFERWIDERHQEVQHHTSGFVVVANYFARRDAFGIVRCYGVRATAQAEADRLSRLDPVACARAFDVERYKSMLDEQLRWVNEVTYTAAEARADWDGLSR